MHSTLRTWTRLAVSACLLASSAIAGSAAQAQSVPPGWVFQGTWHDGRWDGQWVPGGAPGMMPQGPMPQGPMPMGPMQQGPAPIADRHTRHMMDRCDYHHDGAKRHHDRDCERFFNDHPEYATGYGAQPGYSTPPMGPYGQMPYGAAPMGYMMVPVMQAPQPAPYTETKTVTTTYVTDHSTVRYHHVTRAKYHHDKRVYTGR